MDKIRETAMLCVGRAVMFATLAISLVILSFAFDPAVAMKAGGTLALILSAILVWFAQTAHRRKPKDTETWLVLTHDDRPVGDHGAKLFASIMEDVYLFFAVRAFMAAVTLLVAGQVLTALAVLE
jgi:hypothetical protein